nr:hypothetical protein [Ochrobactrum sp. CM-21-5]
MGAADALVHTAQIRIELNVTLLNNLILGLVTLGKVKLPIFIDIASAEGELKSVSPLGPKSARVAVAAKPRIAGIYLELPSIVSVNGRADIPLGNPRQTLLNFSDNDIQNKTIQTAYSENVLTSLTGALLQGLEIDVKLLLIPISLGGVFNLLGGLLTPLAPCSMVWSSEFSIS